MARKVGKREGRSVAKLVTADRAPCAFCHREVDDEVTYGKLYAIGHIQCHYLCALLSCCLVQKGPEEDGLFGFMYKDILAELERSKKHKCSFCGRGGANLGCSVGSCRKQFHLPCGREKNAVSLFYGSYKSFCQAHAPRQKIPAHIMCKAKLRMKDVKKIASQENADNSTEEDMVCVICYELVDAYPSVNTFWPPCCARDAWFHRSCLQRMALSAGMHYLKCPLCNDKINFYDAVVSQGYYVPDRDAAWELEHNAFADIYERALSCAAGTCLCPLGRGHDTDQGMWDIKACLLCGSVGAHAHCIGASETTRYVCLTCTPAKPIDMQALADTIDKLILQEQASSNLRHGPLMPSRMSLRRTKGRPAILNRPSSSGAFNMKTDCESPVSSLNTQSSRNELNLRTPIKLIQTDSYNSPKKPTRESYKSSQQKTPSKLAEQTLNEFNKHTDSYKNMEVTITPMKHLTTDIHRNSESYKNLEASLLSPMKLLEQSLREKVVCMGGNATLDDGVIEILRRRFNRPRPLSKKKKIIDDIVTDLFKNLNSLKQKEQIREWCSPRKCYGITEEQEIQGANDNVSKAPENMVENEENCIHETPKKSKSNGQNSTPKITRLNTNIEKKDKTDGDEKHHSNDGTHDDTSNSTFQLPSEFIAEAINDDSCMTFQSPKRRSIEIKDSSLEISELDHSVNIDVSNITDSAHVTPGVNKCAFKFSPLDKEKLEEYDVGMDLESFKKEYLSEVDRYKCCFNHNHDQNNTNTEKINYRTVIDFAIEAHFHKKATEKKSKKRKLSEGLVLNLNKNDKKRKMSENDLSLYSSDEFEVEKEFKSHTKKVVKDMDINDRDKRKKKAAKDKKRERKNRERRFRDLIQECVINRSNDVNKTQIEEQIPVQRKEEANKQHIKERKREIEEKRMKKSSNDVNKEKNKEKQMKNKLNNDNKTVIDKKHPLHRKLEGKQRIKDRNEKEIKNKLNNDNKTVIDKKHPLHRKREGKEQRIKDRNEKDIKNKPNNYNKTVIDKKHPLHRKLEGKEQHIRDRNEKEIKNRNDENVKLKYNKTLHDRNQEKIGKAKQLSGDKYVIIKCKENNNDRNLDGTKRTKDGGRVKNKIKSKDKIVKDTRVDEVSRRKEKHKNTEKYKTNLDKHANVKKHREKYAIAKRNDDQNIEVTIDKSKSKQKTKLSISNNEKDISVKIKWKKKQFRLKIESKKAEQVARDSKFKQYVLQYFSEVTPKEVLVKPEKEVSPLKRKYVKQDKTPDKLKQMSISNFFKVKSTE